MYEALFTATARHLDVPVTAVDIAFSLSNPDALRALLSGASFQHIEITPRSLLVRMPEPERFVELSVQGAATSVPAFADLDATQRAELVGAISKETGAIAQQFRDGEMLTFSMGTNIAIAR